MSIIMQINPFDFFVDTHGDALDSGYIWIGQPNLDPRQYPVTAYYDEALTIPAPMPLRTSNGYIVRNGSPTFLYINGNYSILVQDKKGRQIYYVPDFLMIGNQSAVTFPDLSSLVPGKGAGLIGYNRQPLTGDVVTVQGMLDAQSYSIWEFVDTINSKPTPDPSTWDWAPAFNAAFSLAGVTGLNITVPAYGGIYNIGSPITLNVATSGASGVSITGLGSPRDCQLQFSAAGYALNIIGTGAEDDSPITRFSIKNIWLSGNGNTVSTGGLNIKRVYIVKVDDVISTGWAGPTANSVSIRNCFNVEWDGGQIANGFPLPAGFNALVVGSESPSAWNSSNIIFRNTLIQYAGQNGVKVLQDASIMDNLTFDNVSFGKNGSYSFSCDSPNVNNITLQNNHFESPGYNGTPNPNIDTGHIFVNRSTSLDVRNNSFQDALIYILLDSVRAFDIGGGNKFFETGSYILTGNDMLRLRTTTGNCIGYWGANEIRTDQIDNLFSIVASGGFRIDLGRQTHTMTLESFWNTEVLPNPLDYKGTIIDRYQSANAPFDRMVSDGTNWFRYMMTSRYKGERSAIPVTVENSGSWYANTDGLVFGTPGSLYSIFGWRTSGGGVWYEMRMLTGG